jgi:predicted hydrocarbon binding protein
MKEERGERKGERGGETNPYIHIPHKECRVSEMTIEPKVVPDRKTSPKMSLDEVEFSSLPHEKDEPGFDEYCAENVSCETGGGKCTSNYEMRTWLETVQNIVGANGLKSILNHAHLQHYQSNFPPKDYQFKIPLEDVANLFKSLNTLFGERGTRSLQLRIGREFTRVTIDNYNPVMAKSLQLATRLVPEATKMRLALRKFAEEMEKALSLNIELTEERNHFLLSIKGIFISEGIESKTPVCHTYVGILHYLIEWITGHPHDVEEVECRAQGFPADVFRISKNAEKQ